MSQKAEDRLEREGWINTKPEVVWAFLTQSEKMIRWMGLEAAAEAKPGGIYRVNITGKEIAAGQFLEATTFRHLVYTWGWEGEEALPPSSPRPSGDIRKRSRCFSPINGSNQSGNLNFRPSTDDLLPSSLHRLTEPPVLSSRNRPLHHRESV